MFDHLLENVGDGDMFWFTIHDQVNESDKPIGFSLRRKNQVSTDVMWSVFDNVPQCNSRFNASNTLPVVVHSVKMPVGFGGDGINWKGRTFASLVQLKRSIIEVGAE